MTSRHAECQWENQMSTKVLDQEHAKSMVTI